MRRVNLPTPSVRLEFSQEFGRMLIELYVKSLLPSTRIEAGSESRERGKMHDSKGRI